MAADLGILAFRWAGGGGTHPQQHPASRPAQCGASCLPTPMEVIQYSLALLVSPASFQAFTRHSFWNALFSFTSPGTTAGPALPSLLCLGEPAVDMLPSVLSLQVVSALSSPKEGLRHLGTWSEVSCHSAPPGTQKMALSAEPDANFDPNTILQTQDCLSRDYEGLRALAKVPLLFKKMVREHLLSTGP